MAAVGLALGAVGVPLLSSTVPLGAMAFAALVGVAALRRESRAAAGGFIVAFALWWVFFIRGAVERCAALNHPGSGSCEIYGTNEQLALASCIGVLGVILVVMAAPRRA